MLNKIVFLAVAIISILMICLGNSNNGLTVLVLCMIGSVLIEIKDAIKRLSKDMQDLKSK